MMKKLLFTLFALLVLGGGSIEAQDLPFGFTSWTHDSYQRYGGTDGTATYSCNAPVCLQQKGVEITQSGNLTVTFTYTSGALRLEIYGVDLVNADGSVAYSDYQFKFAGGNKQGQVYTLSDVQPGTYTLRFWSSVWGSGNQLFGGTKDSKGDIVYGGDAAQGVTFAYNQWDNKAQLSEWKSTGSFVPSGVIALVRNQNFKQYANIHYKDDENLVFTGCKTYNINYNYTGADGGGNERMDIRGVEVMDGSGNLVACDYHEGYTGTNASNRDYKVTIPEGTYTVRTLVATANANNVRCKGNITYSAYSYLDNYTTVKDHLYDNGVLRIGAPVKSALDALDAVIDNAQSSVVEKEAACYVTMTTNNLYLPDGYYYMKNMDNTSSNKVSAAPYAYNDYNMSGNTTHYTLLRADTDVNMAIWKVTNNGNSISIVNGDGKGINNGSNRNTLNFGAFNATQFVNWGEKGIYFTEGIHGSNQDHLKINGVVRLTDWAHSDSQGSNWEFIPVEDINIYNVVVNGAPIGEGYVTYNGNQYAYSGGFFNAASIDKSKLNAQAIDGYRSTIEVSGNTITVNYATGHPYLVFKCERGGIVANSNGNLVTGTYNESDNSQKFLLVNIEGKDYLYSQNLNKFVTTPATGNQFVLVSYPHHAFTTAVATNPNGVYSTIIKINGAKMNNNGRGNMVNGWESEDAGNRYQINEVGGISNEEYATLVASVKAACDAKKADMPSVNATYSSSVGHYGWEHYDVTTQAVTTSQALDTDAENYYTSLFAEIRKFDVAYVPTLNMPSPESFLRIKGVNTECYITGNGTTGRVALRSDADENTILYYDGTHLIGYKNGLGFNETHSVASVGSFEEHTFSASPYQVGNAYYMIKSNYSGSKVLCDGAGSDLLLNRWTAENDKRSAWTIEEIESLPVTIGSTGFATFNAPVAVKVPDNVDAYVCTIGAATGALTLYKIERVKNNENEVCIPANTAVLLHTSTPDTYNFDITTCDEEIEGNGFSGTVAAQAAPADSYTLQKTSGAETVGFYSKTEGAAIGGFKGYIQWTGSGSASVKGFAIDLGSETAIEAIEDALQQQAPMFDMSGRRIQKPQRGLYIQNGRKFIVK